mgnify:CR=1 FL=1
MKSTKKHFALEDNEYLVVAGGHEDMLHNWKICKDGKEMDCVVAIVINRSLEKTQ